MLKSYPKLPNLASVSIEVLSEDLAERDKQSLNPIFGVASIEILKKQQELNAQVKEKAGQFFTTLKNKFQSLANVPWTIENGFYTLMEKIFGEGEQESDLFDKVFEFVDSVQDTVTDAIKQTRSRFARKPLPNLKDNIDLMLLIFNNLHKASEKT